MQWYCRGTCFAEREDLQAPLLCKAPRVGKDMLGKSMSVEAVTWLLSERISVMMIYMRAVACKSLPFVFLPLHQTFREAGEFRQWFARARLALLRISAVAPHAKSIPSSRQRIHCNTSVILAVFKLDISLTFFDVADPPDIVTPTIHLVGIGS